MDRTLIAPMEQLRDFDFVMGARDVLLALGGLAKDVCSQLGYTVAAGFAPSQSTPTPSLNITIGSGRVYQMAAIDALAAGSIPQDLDLIVQQGYNAGQTITLVPPSSGQSQWNLIQAQFSQIDAIRTNDPNNGIVPFYNAANPTQPTTQGVNTVRKATCVLQVISGAAATTGSEVPPQPSNGWVPLYLIDLAGGQSQVTTSQILTAGPSVGTGVPNSYPGAPFLAGFLASHHAGTPGQAPQVNLATEVQGVLPYVNMSPVRTLVNAVLQLYVNASTGSDTNSGLTATAPFQTIQAAVNVAYRYYDFNGFYPQINVANGNYTAPVSFQGLPVGIGTTGVQLIGNITSPQSVTITCTQANCITASLGANVNVQGFTLTTTGGTNSTNACGMACVYGANITFSACNFALCALTHIFAAAGGAVIVAGTLAYNITGSSANHCFSDAGGLITLTNGAVTLSGTPSLASGFVLAQRCGVLQAQGATFTNSGTGIRYSAVNNGVITTGGGGANFFPGNAAGQTLTGGQYS